MVSVIILSYNYAQLIQKSIDSVLSQTISDWELIICDDCSQDNSLDILSSYAAQHNIKIHVNPRNLGIYPNAETGIAHSRGKYIKILMADDWLHPDYLKETVALMERYPSMGLCSVRAELQNSYGKILEVRCEPNKFSGFCAKKVAMTASTLHVNPIGNPSRVIFRRSAYDQVGGFDLDIEYCTEYDLWLRILEDWDAGFLAKVLSYELQHTENATLSYYSNGRHLASGEQMFVKLFRQHSFFKNRFLRQQKVWLFGWSTYWENAYRQLWNNRPEELIALLKIVVRRSLPVFWVFFALWRFVVFVVRKSFAKYPLGKTEAV